MKQMREWPYMNAFMDDGGDIWMIPTSTDERWIIRRSPAGTEHLSHTLQDGQQRQDFSGDYTCHKVWMPQVACSADPSLSAHMTLRDGESKVRYVCKDHAPYSLALMHHAAKHSYEDAVKEEARAARLVPAGTSRVELMHHAVAVDVFGDAESGATISVSKKWTVDILVNDTLVIEYDGRRWHAGDDRRLVDTRKTMDLLDAGYRVVRLREDGLESLHIMHPNYREIGVSASSPQPASVINAVKMWHEQAA